MIKVIDNGNPTDMKVVAHDPSNESVMLEDPLTGFRSRFVDGYPNVIDEDRGQASRDEHGKPDRFRSHKATRGEIEAAMGGA